MKKGRAKKLLGICIFLMGLMIFSVLPVQAAAPRMYANVIFFLTFLFIVSGTVIRNFIIYGCLFKIFFINVRPLCLSIVL